jgi:hypothetical protein
MERRISLGKLAVLAALLHAFACIAAAGELPTARSGSHPVEPVDSIGPAAAVDAPAAACDCDAPAKPKASPSPYRDPFYNNDFSALDKPDQVSSDPFDALKRICVAPRTTLDLGGEYRLRFHDEHNLLLNGLDNDFLLQRTRLYGDLWYDGWLRAYAEFIDATSAFEDLTPRTNEENRSDFLNLFGEAKLWADGCGRSLSARVGRQELLYGNQRLISPLDWANTRRTFDGAKLFWKSDTWNVDGFWTRPVPFSQHTNNDHNFDHPDQSQQFYGAYAAYHAIENHTWDFFYLRLEEADLRNSAGARIGRSDANTFGARYLGRCSEWLWELEGGYQFGDFGALDQSAGYYTVGLGYEFRCLPWKPTLWTYFDWASGDSDPTDGDRGTFNQLFPLGHKYFGYADLVGRQNIEDWNFLFTAKPHDRVSLLAWWHIFRLEESRDSLYNAAGTATRTDATGASGTDVGQELDFTVQIQFNQHADVLFGYSHFFAGDFIANTGVGDDADFFYTTFSFKF